MFANNFVKFWTTGSGETRSEAPRFRDKIKMYQFSLHWLREIVIERLQICIFSICILIALWKYIYYQSLQQRRTSCLLLPAFLGYYMTLIIDEILRLHHPHPHPRPPRLAFNLRIPPTEVGAQMMIPLTWLLIWF